MESTPSTPVIPSTPTGPVIKLPESLPLPPAVILPTPPPPTVAPPKATIKDGNLLVTRVSDEQKRFGVVIKDGTIRLSPANVQTYELKQEVGQNCYVAMKDVLPGGLNSGGGKVNVVVTAIDKNGGRSDELVLDYTIPTPPADPPAKDKPEDEKKNSLATAIEDISKSLTEIEKALASTGELDLMESRSKIKEIGVHCARLQDEYGEKNPKIVELQARRMAALDEINHAIGDESPTSKITDTEDLEDRVGGLEGDVADIKTELAKKASQAGLDRVEAEVGKIQPDMGREFESMRTLIAGLKTPSPAAPPSSDGGSETGDTGVGQTSAPKPGKNWLIWFVLMVGILGTILLILGIGGWIRSSFLEGVLLGSKGSGVSTMMMVPATATTNATPAQAVATPSVTTPQAPTQGELAKIAEEMKAIRNDQARFLERENSLVVKPVPTNQVVGEVKATAAKSVTVTGNGNILAGHDVTVVNNYNHFSPASSGNRNCSVATLPAPTTVSQVTGTSLAPPATGEAIVGRFWSPTLMSGYVCIPKAADGSGSEGFWVYIAQPPAPGTKSP